MNKTKSLFRGFSFVLILMMACHCFSEDLFKPMKNTDTIWLHEMDLSKMKQGYRTAQICQNTSFKPMKMKGKHYKQGVGTHSRSEYIIDLKGNAVAFRSIAGIDDISEDRGSVEFCVYVDNRLQAMSPVLRGGSDPYTFDVSLKDARWLLLLVTADQDRGNCDASNWAEAHLVVKPGLSDDQKPVAVKLKDIEPDLYMGKAPDAPFIASPMVVGTTPGNEFLYRIGVQGKCPFKYIVKGLPRGLKLNKKKGLITGKVKKAGEYSVTITAENDCGEDTKTLLIRAGEKMLAQTPPMGWNSWNAWGIKIKAEHVLQTKEALLKSGLADLGYLYINVDDGWQGPKRDKKGVLPPSKEFGGSFKELADELHKDGLKLGIYSSPGPKTCGYKLGSYEYEQIDADTWADWGIDYLKYDFCYYGKIIPDIHSRSDQKVPYINMRKALDNCDRDIVYSFCQYGMQEGWQWAGAVGGNVWRTTGDIINSWESMSRNGFSQQAMHPFSGPGHWNDPDMLILGSIGWGHREPVPTSLTRNEQMTHFGLWCMLASPLLLGCDMTKLDEFTMALISNPELIAVDQDPLGKQAWRVQQNRDKLTEIWARPLADGSWAVAFFNRGMLHEKITLDGNEISLIGPKKVRDLFQRKDLPQALRELTLEVPPHGVRIVKLTHTPGFP